jgi:Bacterial HORMA domain family 1
MSQTYTTTDTSTYTEARARAVMLSVLEDLLVLAASRKIDIEKAKAWREDLLYLLNAGVLKYFELQYYSPKGTKIEGYKYTLSDDGSLQENSPSGGIDPYDVPEGAIVNLFADIDYSKKNINEVLRYLSQRGWGTNGTPLGGQAVYERAYSKDGYGLQRYKVSL